MSMPLEKPKQLKAEIRELEEYLAQQQASVDVALEAGNYQLRKLSADVMELTTEKEDLLREKLLLQNRITEYETKLERAKELYTSTVSRYREDIENARTQHSRLLSTAS